MVPEAFFVPQGPTGANAQRFESTVLTRGPWSPDHQHAGPPAGLVARAVESADGGQGKRVGRITYEILRPVPIAPLEVSAEVVRPGGRVDLVEASLVADGDVVMRARAWRLRVADLGEALSALPEVARRGEPAPEFASASAEPFFDVGWDEGYHTAIEARFVSGAFRRAGPSVVWMRQLVPLVAGEEPSPLQRVAVAADSGNGVSAWADPREVVFVNTDLTIALSRPLRGVWVGMDATTVLDDGGSGLAESRLFDDHGTIGRAVQTLFVGHASG